MPPPDIAMSHRMKVDPCILKLLDTQIVKHQDKIICNSDRVKNISGRRTKLHSFRYIKLSSRADAKIIFERCNAHYEHSFGVIIRSTEI